MEQGLIREFVTSYSLRTGVKAYLHLDHCRKIDTVKLAVDSGWDSVMIDASHLSLDENIKLTNQVSVYAHAKGVLVEAEVGQIQGVEDDAVSDTDGIADIHDIERFLQGTNVDMIAAAVGTCHGLYRKTPDIRYELIKEVGILTDKPFVVHGGSGLSDANFEKLLSFTHVKKINISTELKQAYRNGIINAEKNGMLMRDGFDVMAVKREIYYAIKTTAAYKLRLLNKESRDE